MSDNTILDPRWLPIKYNWDTEEVLMARVDQSDYGSYTDSIMKRVMSRELRYKTVPKSDIPDIPYTKTLYVMHIAYGGSTLISRLLDVPGVFQSHIEPVCHGSGRLYGNLSLSKLYSRTFSNEIPVIKCLPVEAEHIDEYVNRNNANVCVLFHQSLENFIISCFNSGSDRLNKAIMNCRVYLSEEPSGEIPDEEAVQLFIRYWTSLMSCYQSSVRTQDNTRVIGLRSEDFYTDPVRYAIAMGELVGGTYAPVDIERAYRKLDVHSKWGTPFNNDRRINQFNDALERARPHLDANKEIMAELQSRFEFPLDRLLIV